MKVTYKEVKAKQKADLKSKTSKYFIYRKFSTPFTYLFVRLNLSPCMVSIISIFPSLIGFCFLYFGTYLLIFIGLLFIMLSRVLDMSDGEVARFTNPKAMDVMYKDIEGPYFDTFSSRIFNICFTMGLGIGLYHLYDNEVFIIMGAILTLVFTMEVVQFSSMMDYLKRGVIDRGLNNNLSNKKIQDELIKEVNKGRSWSEQNIFMRLFGILPFQGLIYSRDLIVMILMLFVLIEWISGIIILPFYVFTVITVKTIRISHRVYKINKEKYMSKVLIRLKNQNKGQGNKS